MNHLMITQILRKNEIFYFFAPPLKQNTLTMPYTPYETITRFTAGGVV